MFLNVFGQGRKPLKLYLYPMYGESVPSQCVHTRRLRISKLHHVQMIIPKKSGSIFAVFCS